MEGNVLSTKTEYQREVNKVIYKVMKNNIMKDAGQNPVFSW